MRPLRFLLALVLLGGAFVGFGTGFASLHHGGSHCAHSAPTPP